MIRVSYRIIYLKESFFNTNTRQHITVISLTRFDLFLLSKDVKERPLDSKYCQNVIHAEVIKSQSNLQLPKQNSPEKYSKLNS